MLRNKGKGFGTKCTLAIRRNTNLVWSSCKISRHIVILHGLGLLNDVLTWPFAIISVVFLLFAPKQ